MSKNLPACPVEVTLMLISDRMQQWVLEYQKQHKQNDYV